MRPTPIQSQLVRLQLRAIALGALSALGVAGGCTGNDHSPLTAPGAAGQSRGAGVPAADLALTNDLALALLSSDAAWTLAKTGSRNGATVTWTITASRTLTVGNELLVCGRLNLTNAGSAPATIGNVVVNLQSRVQNKWVTRASDVADATLGDAAITTRIHAPASSEGRGSFTESAASGALTFMDATNSSVLSLSPEIAVGAGQTRTLEFQAAFDNNVLQLPKGAAIRSELIVSFGNATARGNSTPNLDINGNGQIDADETHVRSVPSRLGLVVPPATVDPGDVALSDAVADIVTTGTVTLSNTVFALGATSGTVTATFDPGASGGTITNCAHLTSPGHTVTSGGITFTHVGALSLQACDTQTIGATTCSAGSPGCGWPAGAEQTLTQANWDAPDSPLDLYYDAVYASNAFLLDVGIVGSSTYSLTFSSAAALFKYFLATGPAAGLNSDYLDPIATSAGAFGGDVVALKLNVDFSDANLVPRTGPPFGDLLLCNVTPSALDGSTVRQLLSASNTLLAGAPSPYALSDIALLVHDVDAAFIGGFPNSWAQSHLADSTTGCGP